MHRNWLQELDTDNARGPNKIHLHMHIAIIHKETKAISKGRTSATTEAPRDALCLLTFRKLLHSCPKIAFEKACST